MPSYKGLREPESEAHAARTIEHLLALRQQLRAEVPQKTAQETLLLATWNLRDFDSNKFGQGPRLPEAYHYVAEIVGAFDLVAIQEVNEDLRPLQRVLRLLGPSWDHIVTDVTEGPSGNGERTAFVFDRRKVSFRNVAGEVVLPLASSIGGGAVDITLPRGHTIEWTKPGKLDLDGHGELALEKGQGLRLPEKGYRIRLPEGQRLTAYKQFARTPFLASFQAGWFKFTLATVHLYYGSDSGPGLARRIEEIDAVAAYFRKRSEEARERYRTGENFVLLGDFNIVDPEDESMKALTRHGFTVPQGHFKSNVGQTKYYDQIAFMVKPDELQLGPGHLAEGGEPSYAGAFDLFRSVYRDDELATYHDLMANTQLRDVHPKGKKKGKPRTDAEKADYYQKEWRTWQLSDHRPLWVELRIDFSDAYLARVRRELP